MTKERKEREEFYKKYSEQFHDYEIFKQIIDKLYDEVLNCEDWHERRELIDEIGNLILAYGYSIRK